MNGGLILWKWRASVGDHIRMCFLNTWSRLYVVARATLEDWTAFAVALKRHAVENEVRRVKETGFGPRYEIDGELETPSEKRPRIRTVWQLDIGQNAPRLLTAYPLEGFHDS